MNTMNVTPSYKQFGIPLMVKLSLVDYHIVFQFQVTLSVILTAAGVIIAALGDFSFDLFGYSMALTSVFFQV